jgi:hypothetical protein
MSEQEREKVHRRGESRGDGEQREQREQREFKSSRVQEREQREGRGEDTNTTTAYQRARKELVRQIDNANSDGITTTGV